MFPTPKSLATVSALAVTVTLHGVIAAAPAAATSPTGSPTISAAHVSAAAAPASLSIAPSVYVGGQSILWRGNIGRSGARRVHLEFNMGRRGDSWTALDDGFRATTSSSGSFSFRHPAPSMFNVRYRVAAKGVHTPAVRFEAVSQDVYLSVPGSVGAGQRFRIYVDTTVVSPGQRAAPPAFEGRVLTLQRRVDGNRWQTLDQTTADSRGHGSFVTTAGGSGTVVYRVRQENWTANGHRIGWTASYPRYVTVSGSGRAGAIVEEDLAAEATAAAGLSAFQASSGGPARTAAATRGWGRPRFDFAWEFGESLSSLPFRGSSIRGGWVDTADGTGRAAKHNGGLMLSSHRVMSGGDPGGLGSTSATLRGNAAKYGRWEAKMRLKRHNTGRPDYRAVIELVPETNTTCAGQTITVAKYRIGGKKVRIGAKSLGGKRWRAARKIRLGSADHAFAVEMSRKRISWFHNGRVIGALRSRAAVPDRPMTLRLRLLGGAARRDEAQFISDWQRAYPLKAGKKVKKGPKLKKGSFRGGC